MFSKSAITAVVSFLALAASLFGIEVPQEVKDALVDHGYNLGLAVIGLIAAGKAIYDAYKRRKAS